MKKIIIFSLVILSGLFFTNCSSELQDNTAGAVLGGYVTVDNANLNYVVGDGGTYAFDMLTHENSDYDIKSVKIYKSAVIYDAASDSILTTNEVLSETIDLSSNTNTKVSSKAYSYADLIEGLTLNGNSLPASDGDLSIGDKFEFRIETVMANGETYQQAYTVNMTVSTRFAGTYLVTAGSYYRLGVLSADMWVGELMVIESIDAKTYRWTDWGAASGWTGNNLYFVVEDDGTITYPAEWDGVAQTLNDQPLTTCESNASDLSNVNCAGSNYVIKDDVNGKDQLLLVHGYYTAGSGPREFDFTLVKK
ncbi:MAG: hypothetical protein R2771_08435 [Saprospiraceae bacterium]